MLSKIITYFLETRPKFLILSVAINALGTSMAWYFGSFNIFYSLLCLAGLLLLHVSTNVLNDYFDFKSGVDIVAKPTPFSGGSGMILSGAVSPAEALWIGIASFLLAAPIGLYFLLIKGWVLLPLFLTGGIFVLMGTSHFTKIGYSAGELAAGLGLGTLPVLGINLILRGHADWNTVFACIPSGILVFNLLFLNEFPDIEADAKGGRKTLAIILGLNRSAVLYSAFTSLVYIWIIAGVIFKIIPSPCLISLITLPLAVKAVKASFGHNDLKKLVPGLGANIGVVILTQFLLAAGYVLGGIIGV